jgi:hypothetical protein
MVAITATGANAAPALRDVYMGSFPARPAWSGGFSPLDK